MLDENLRGTNMLVVDTFDYNAHVFELILQGEKLYLKFESDSRLIKRLVIKPDCWVYFQNGGYEQGVNLFRPLNPALNKILAMDFSIDPDIFQTLIDNGLISYSKAMADLYDLDPIFSSDYSYHTRDYKRKNNRSKVLEKLKNGNFN